MREFFGSPYGLYSEDVTDGGFREFWHNVDRFTIIESPYQNAQRENLDYLDEAIRDCFERKEIPFASHKMYNTALRDSLENERLAGMYAGWAMMRIAQTGIQCAVYADLGITRGMEGGIEHAAKLGIPIQFRRIRLED